MTAPWKTTIAALASLAAGSAWAPAAAQGDDTLRIVTGYRVTTLDPIRSAAAGNIEAFGQLYARLLRKTPEGELRPGLAESWEASEDGLTYTFELRDARFSDGTPIEASDVAFSLNRAAKDPESAYPAAFASVEEAVAIDEDTVELRLNAPSAPILSYMEIFNAGIVSADDVEARGEDAFAGGDPVTSGPYTVEEWRPNDRLILAANSEYWREGHPRIERVEIVEVEDPNTRTSMIEAGEVDAAVDVQWSQVERLRQADGIRVPLEPSTWINVVLLNHDREPFSNLAARRAALMALDRAAVAEAITLGNAAVAQTTLPISLDFAAPQDMPAMDPAGARALLAEAGLEGAEVTLMATPGSQQVAALLKALWDQAGFAVTIDQIDGGSFWERLPAGEYDAVPSAWYNETEDPDLAVRWALCGDCGNRAFYTNYDNPRVNELTEAALIEGDEARRAEMYAEIQRITTEEVTNIPLYDRPFVIAYRDRVDGLTLTPSLQWTLEEAELRE
jgi:peptide/nickel transport system substrate-binding protein